MSFRLGVTYSLCARQWARSQSRVMRGAGVGDIGVAKNVTRCPEEVGPSIKYTVLFAEMSARGRGGGGVASRHETATSLGVGASTYATNDRVETVSAQSEGVLGTCWLTQRLCSCVITGSSSFAETGRVVAEGVSAFSDHNLCRKRC